MDPLKSAIWLTCLKLQFIVLWICETFRLVHIQIFYYEFRSLLLICIVSFRTLIHWCRVTQSLKKSNSPKELIKFNNWTGVLCAQQRILHFALWLSAVRQGLGPPSREQNRFTTSACSSWFLLWAQFWTGRAVQSTGNAGAVPIGNLFEADFY